MERQLDHLEFHLNGNFLGPQGVHRDVFYDESRAFSKQEPDIFYADVTLEYRINKQNTSSVWSVQMMNVSGHEEFYGYRYNLKDNSIDAERELILIPNISYRIEF